MNQRAGLGLHQLCFACTPQNATETTEHRPIKEGWIFEFGGCFGSFSLHILAISVRRLMEKESKHMVRFMKCHLVMRCRDSFVVPVCARELGVMKDGLGFCYLHSSAVSTCPRSAGRRFTLISQAAQPSGVCDTTSDKGTIECDKAETPSFPISCWGSLRRALALSDSAASVLVAEGSGGTTAANHTSCFTKSSIEE